LEQFLLDRASELTAAAFERVDPASGAVREANFSYSRGGLVLATVYVERLERGRLVISYSFCRGEL
jgi:hypothetical protein